MASNDSASNDVAAWRRRSPVAVGARFVARHGWVPLSVLAVVMTGSLVLNAAWPFWGESPAPPWLPFVRANLWFPLAVVLAAIASTRRFTGRFPSNLHWLMIVASLTLLLGAAAYLPASEGHSPIAYLTWVFDLFTSTDAGTVPDPAPPAFEFARLGGVLTVLLAALSVAMRVWRTQFDRWLVQVGLDLDVVVGASDQTLALARQLVQERRAEPLAPSWRHWDVRQLLSRWIARLASGVVLVHPNRDDPVIADFRAVGCRVLINDPYDSSVLAGLAVTGGRPAVRRVFAADRTEADNRRVVDALHTVLEGDLSRQSQHGYRKLIARPLRWLLDVLVPQGALGWVPRLVAVMDDPREAREFRLAHLQSDRCFVDALCPDELLARDITAAIDRANRARVVVLGGGPLTLALLDEIALRGAFRRELDRCSPDGTPTGGDFPFRQVTVAGPEAALLVEEWQLFRTPAALHPELLVEALDALWDEALRGVDDATTAIVVTEPASTPVRARASHVNRLHPQALVFCPDERTIGLDLGADAPDTPGRILIGFGPSLLQGGHIPEDYWTVLARQAHEVYCRESPKSLVTRRPWGDASLTEEERLPAFVREDNISQQRNVMAQVARILTERKLGPGWQNVTAGQLRRTLSNTDLTAVARAEHERWCATRLATGWSWDDGSIDEQKREWLARNPNLVAWDTGQPLGGGTFTKERSKGVADLQQWNVDSVARIVARLHLAGFAPTASAAGTPERYRRRPVRVMATQLGLARTWVTGNRSTLTAEQGDWWVTDANGVARSVAAADFDRLYRPLTKSGEGTPFTHESHGSVWAYQCAEADEVMTLEGAAAARPGDWIVMDHGTAWPVPDEHFRTNYGPLVGTVLDSVTREST